jgi:hypothetical protein
VPDNVATTPAVASPDIQKHLQEIWEKSGEKDRKAFMNKIQVQ